MSHIIDRINDLENELNTTKEKLEAQQACFRYAVKILKFESPILNTYDWIVSNIDWCFKDRKLNMNEIYERYCNNVIAPVSRNEFDICVLLTSLKGDIVQEV
jgi:hypothetical protein